MSDQTTQKEKVMGKINEIKKNVETFIADVNVNELKESLNTMVKDAQKDFSNLVDKDLGVLKTKFAKEKGILEKKAKKFYEGHKKEINALQAKFEKMVKFLFYQFYLYLYLDFFSCRFQNLTMNLY